MNTSKQLKIPADVPLGSHSRTIGKAGSKEIIGAGFMRKPQTIEDHMDYIPRQYSLVYVIHGAGEYIDHQNRSRPLQPGSYFQRLPEYRHTTRLQKNCDWRECFMDFGPAFTSGLIAMHLIDPDHPVGFAGARQSWVDAFADICRVIINGPDHELPALLPKMLDLHQRILQQGHGADEDDRNMVRTAMLFLSGNLRQRINLSRYSAKQGWGYEHFRKTFLSTAGITPGQYRIRCRMDRARGLLRTNTDLTISEIAEELGYTGLYEFSAQFKKHVGLSPGAYRRTV